MAKTPGIGKSAAGNSKKSRAAKPAADTKAGPKKQGRPAKTKAAQKEPPAS